MWCDVEQLNSHNRKFCKLYFKLKCVCIITIRTRDLHTSDPNDLLWNTVCYMMQLNRIKLYSWFVRTQLHFQQLWTLRHWISDTPLQYGKSGKQSDFSSLFDGFVIICVDWRHVMDISFMQSISPFFRSVFSFVPFRVAAGKAEKWYITHKKSNILFSVKFVRFRIANTSLGTWFNSTSNKLSGPHIKMRCIFVTFVHYKISKYIVELRLDSLYQPIETEMNDFAKDWIRNENATRRKVCLCISYVYFQCTTKKKKQFAKYCISLIWNRSVCVTWDIRFQTHRKLQPVITVRDKSSEHE